MPYRLKRFLLYLAVVGIVVWTAAPYLWLIISSLSYKIDLLDVPLRWIPRRLTLENYYSLFYMRGSEFGQCTSVLAIPWKFSHHIFDHDVHLFDPGCSGCIRDRPA
ncbi:MAG: hypothetical protein QM730_05800 [Anaerolineales bacterium]